MVTIFICIGYSVDYSVEFVVTILLIQDKVGLETDQYSVAIGRGVLIVCIFVAYTILMKTFMTYQNQIREAEKRVKQKTENKKKK